MANLQKLLRWTTWPLNRLDPDRLRREEDLRASLLRRLLVAVTLATILYAALGVLRIARSELFPFDAMEMLAAIGLSSWLLARRMIPAATMWLLVIMSHPVSFLVATYGVASPATALFLPTIVVCGLLLGRYLLLMWTCVCSAIVLWLAWVQSRREPIDPLSTPLQALVPASVWWWALFAATAWLIYLFSVNLERLLQVARRQAETRSRLLELLLREPNLEKLLQPVAQAVAEELKAACVTLWRLDDSSGVFRRLAIVPSESEPSEVPALQRADEIGTLPVAPENGGVIRLSARAEIIAQAAPLFPDIAKVAEVLLLPLKAGGAPAGLLAIAFDHLDPYPPERLELTHASGQLVSLCVEMTRLAAVDRKSAVLAERNRMAEEIHDTLAQGFTGILVQLAAAEEMLPRDAALAQGHLEASRELAKTCLEEARRSVWALRPSALVEGDLHAALSEIARQLGGDRIPVRVEVTGNRYVLPPEIEGDLLRIGQEAMTNAVRHAQPHELAIRLEYEPGVVRLTVNELGGARISAKLASSDGFGLVSMRERARRIGGKLDISHQEGEGTSVSIEVPLRNARCRTNSSV